MDRFSSASWSVAGSRKSLRRCSKISSAECSARKVEVAVRIVGGKFKGQTLAAPSGRDTRPTSDRVREAIFNILAHGTAAVPLEGARVLDLFAGTGAMGLEALSRGAKFCQFVDD